MNEKPMNYALEKKVKTISEIVEVMQSGITKEVKGFRKRDLTCLFETTPTDNDSVENKMYDSLWITFLTPSDVGKHQELTMTELKGLYFGENVFNQKKSMMTMLKHFAYQRLRKELFETPKGIIHNLCYLCGRAEQPNKVIKRVVVEEGVYNNGSGPQDIFRSKQIGYSPLDKLCDKGLFSISLNDGTLDDRAREIVQTIEQYKTEKQKLSKKGEVVPLDDSDVRNAFIDCGANLNP